MPKKTICFILYDIFFFLLLLFLLLQMSVKSEVEYFNMKDLKLLF